MTLKEILEIDIKNKSVCIIGLPASGKTYLSLQLSDKDHRFIHTDHYMAYKFEEASYAALNEVLLWPGEVVIEGVQCYRMLRHGLLENVWSPDIIIECERPRHKREQVYRDERDLSKLRFQRNFAIGLQKTYNDYLAALPLDNRPHFITWHNDN